MLVPRQDAAEAVTSVAVQAGSAMRPLAGRDTESSLMGRAHR
jgi:hypothetical protein